MEFRGVCYSCGRDYFNLDMIPLTFILINFIQAIWHKYLIDKNRLIQSRQKIIEYSVASIVAGVILNIGLGCPILPLILFCVLTRLAFFSPFLNVLRGGIKNIFYDSPTSKKRKWTFDWFIAETGLPIWLVQIIFMFAFISYLIIYYA